MFLSGVQVRIHLDSRLKHARMTVFKNSDQKRRGHPHAYIGQNRQPHQRSPRSANRYRQKARGDSYHERYGIVQHTTDLGQKFVDAGYVTIVPDFFSRFTGDRVALARGDDRCELSDAEVLVDLDAVVEHLKSIPQADTTKVAMSGVCQTGRQPILVAAKRNLLSAAVVLYGAVYDADWKSHPIRQEPIDKLMREMSCPLAAVFGELDNLIHRDN